jgi:hypothetical protein
MLDVFHAAEHIGDAAKAIWTAPEVAALRREAGVAALLAEAKAGVERLIGALFAELPWGCDGSHCAPCELPGEPADAPELCRPPRAVKYSLFRPIVAHRRAGYAGRARAWPALRVCPSEYPRANGSSPLAS